MNRYTEEEVWAFLKGWVLPDFATKENTFIKWNSPTVIESIYVCGKDKGECPGCPAHVRYE